ncbi:VOC family protein [Pyxidicoccus fallax]|uniref:VOC family protein n=1 Tax=Pyxidicoccus fallax TaxID=394095 RepID=A0A848LY53_9BACT|nr:VOC family protein [Pyxidicoccus fallax]NMO22549.1 VOC family protein [Pyxidicoccus fallax]NPC84525.1 VOC family protein [Pyxidicoccus fallax]
MSSAANGRSFQTGHVGITVTNLERSTRFYRDVFGFEVTAESREKGREFVFLSEGKRLVLALWPQGTERFDRNRAGLHHLSFQVEGMFEVKEVEKKLKSLGVAFLHDGVVPHGEGLSSGGIFFEDPDGTRLEIYAPTGAEGHAAPTPGAPSCGFF